MLWPSSHWTPYRAHTRQKCLCRSLRTCRKWLPSCPPTVPWIICTLVQPTTCHWWHLGWRWHRRHVRFRLVSHCWESNPMSQALCKLCEWHRTFRKRFLIPLARLVSRPSRFYQCLIYQGIWKVSSHLSFLIGRHSLEGHSRDHWNRLSIHSRWKQKSRYESSVWC